MRKFFYISYRILNKFKNFNFLFTYDGKVDVLFLPFSTLNAIIPFKKNVRVVSIIYDLQHIEYPFFFTRKEIKNRNFMYKWISENAHHVISISKKTKSDFHQYTNYNLNNITTIPIPVSIENIDAFNFQDKLSVNNQLISKPYLLYPANFWPHKNHKLLFIALAMAIKRGVNLDIQLVLIGDELNKGDEYKLLTKKLGIENNVIFGSFVDEKSKYLLLKNALALIYPSLFEGFGMPLIEAIILKTPILCSDLDVLNEIIDNFGYVFNPKKPKSIADAIFKISTDKKLTAQANKNNLLLKNKVPLIKKVVKSYQEILFTDF